MIVSPPMTTQLAGEQDGPHRSVRRLTLRLFQQPVDHEHRMRPVVQL